MLARVVRASDEGKAETHVTPDQAEELRGRIRTMALTARAGTEWHAVTALAFCGTKTDRALLERIFSDPSLEPTVQKHARESVESTKKRPNSATR